MQTRAGKRPNVVENNADAGTGGFQNIQGTKEFLWEAAGRPRQGGVLDKHPPITPVSGLEP